MSPASSAPATAARSASTPAGSRWAAPGGWTPTCSGTWATSRTSGQGLRSASGSSASPCSATAYPTCARSGRTTCASWGSSDGGAMKVPVGWLREYVAFEWPVEELARRLVFTSCEVDRIVRRGVPDAGGNLAHFCVGRVVDAGRHPNADKLQVTRVDVGDGEPRQIVCGAWNFGAGATVAVVLPGGVMPGGELTIERRKLRGQRSDGMILSEHEIGLGQDHAGIMVLEGDLEPGTPLADVLPLGDDVLEIETGYNRPDLTSVYGIAREVAALTGTELAPPPGARDTVSRAPERDDVRVDVEDLERCPRYIGRLFREVSVGESPPWLKARL